MEDNFNFAEGGGAYYTQDFTLKTLNILTSAGQRFEMKKLLVELSYYEDLYSFAISGYIILKDAQGFIESLQLTGNEFIEVSFGKVKDAPNSTDQIFRIYKVGPRTASTNMSTEYYTLYFCSEELLLSEQIKISKSYNMEIYNIINHIVTDYLQVNKETKVPLHGRI